MIKSYPLHNNVDFCLTTYLSDYLNLDQSKEYVAILKSDLDRLNETEKWRQLQAQLLSVQESALTSEPDIYANPEWEKSGRVHDWRNHISEDIRKIWQTFTTAQRRTLVENAEMEADAEQWD